MSFKSNQHPPQAGGLGEASGSLGEALSLAIPSIISNITVPLLGLIDLTIVGHIGDETYISAIATGSMIFNVIYWIFGFLRMGTSGMTAQAYGRKDRREVTSVLRMSAGTGAGIGIFFVIIQWLILRFMLWAMNTPTDAVPFVTQYFDIVIWGAPAMLCLYALNGWFIGMQDTRTPMVVAITQNIINIIASLFFVFVMGWKIAGVATGTLIAQWSGVLMSLYRIHNSEFIIHNFSISNILHSKSIQHSTLNIQHSKSIQHSTFNTQHSKSIQHSTLNIQHSESIQHSTLNIQHSKSIQHFLYVNRDIFLRTLCLVAVNLFFTSAGGKQGALILAVNALLITLYTLFSYVMDGFAYAGEALCGKYYGAGDMQGFRNTVRSLSIWGAVMVVIFTLLYIIGGRGFLGLLTSNTRVVDAAMDYLPWAIAIPICGVTAFIYDGIFVGITETKGMLLSSATAAAVFFAAYYLLSPTLANTALWIAFLLFLLVRGIVEYFVLKIKSQY